MENDDHPRFYTVLSNIGFLFLWIGQLLAQMADRVFVYVLMIIAYKLTNSNLGVAIPLLSFGIPSLLFGSLAGVFVDKLDRKGILIISDILRGVLILLLIPFMSNSLVLIFVVSFLIYSISQFFAPAEAASIPELVKKKDLIVANSLFLVTWIGASIFGFGLGAPLVGFLGNEAAFVVAACFYFISAGAIFMIPLKQRELKKESVRFNFFKDLMLGLEFIRRNFIVKFSLIKMFIATSAIAVISLLAISYAKDILKIGASNFGYLIVSVGLGMIIGLPLLERLSHIINKGKLTIIGFFTSGIVIILISYTENLKVAFLLTFLLGICNIFITSSLQTILQHHIPAKIRGRVFGVQNMLINSAFVFPVILWGIIADALGTQFALTFLGVIVIIFGSIGILIPKFRNI